MVRLLVVVTSHGKITVFSLPCHRVLLVGPEVLGVRQHRHPEKQQFHRDEHLIRSTTIRPINLQLPCLLCYPAVLLALWDPGPLAVLENPDDKNAISECKCITRGAQSSSANFTCQHADSDWQHLPGSLSRPSRPPRCRLLEVPVSRKR